jgi:hypothetical protein
MVNMAQIDALKNAIKALPNADYVQLRQWFWEKDWQEWDKQIEKDSANGKLDFLVREALDERSKGKLRNL